MGVDASVGVAVRGVGVGVAALGVGVGVGVGGGFNNMSLLTAVVVNTVESGLTTCCDDVSNRMLVEIFCFVVLGANGSTASWKFPIGGVPRLAGSSARDRSMRPEAFASAMVVFFTIRASGD